MLKNVFVSTLTIAAILGQGELLARESLSQIPSATANTGVEDYDSDYMLVYGTSEIHQDAARLGSLPWHPGYPTGYYAEPNQLVHYTVNCPSYKGNIMPHLLIGTYSRYKDKINPDMFELKQEVNSYVKAGEKGGIIYAYTPMNKYAYGANCRLNLVDARPMPWYRLGTTTHSAWRDMLNNYPTPDVVLESERAIIVASRENALRYVNENQDKVLQAIDRVINAQDNILMLTKDEGYITTSSRSQHKILITETDDPDSFMYATNHRTVFNKDVMGNILTEKGFSQDGWGPWHELGHMHQQQAWRWSSIIEVQVNIFSLAAEREMGIYPSHWMAVAKSWPRAIKFLHKTEAQRDFNQDTELGNEGRLMMFH